MSSKKSLIVAVGLFLSALAPTLLPEPLPASPQEEPPADAFAALVRLADRRDYSSAIQATSEFLSAHDASPWRERALYLLASCSKRAGRLTEALVLYKRASQEHELLKDYSDYNVASILLKLGAHQGALAEADAFLENHPRSRLRTKVLAVKAEAHAALGEKAEAERMYGTLLGSSISSEERVEILHRYAEFLAAHGDWEKAHARFLEIFIEHPEYERDREVARSLATLREQAPIPLAPPSTLTLYSRARRLIDLRLYDRAVETLKDVTSNSTGTLLTDARYSLALCYERTRNRERSIELLRQFIEEHPNDRRVPDALYHLGANHWNLNQYKEATSTLERLVAQHPQTQDSARGLYVLGRIAAEKGDEEQALRIFSQIADRHQGTQEAAESLWQWGWLAYMKGDNELAAQVFERLGRSSQDGSRSAQAYFWLGRVRENLQDTNAAAETYQSVIRQFPLSYYSMRAAERLSVLCGGCRQEPAYPASYAAPSAPELHANEDVSLSEEARYHAARAEELAILHFREDAKEEIDLVSLSLPSDLSHTIYLANLYALSDNCLQSMKLYHEIYSRHAGGSGGTNELPAFVLQGLFPLPYWEEVEEAAAKHGMDPMLILSMMRQESAFDYRAVSPAGALGLLQLLPSTARKAGGGAALGEFGPSMLFDPTVNVALGTEHFAKVLNMAGGNVVLALAGYNAGEHKIREWQDRFPTDDMTEFIEHIPYRETRAYIRNVLRNHAIYAAIYGERGAALVGSERGSEHD